MLEHQIDEAAQIAGERREFQAPHALGVVERQWRGAVPAEDVGEPRTREHALRRIAGDREDELQLVEAAVQRDVPQAQLRVERRVDHVGHGAAERIRPLRLEAVALQLLRQRCAQHRVVDVLKVEVLEDFVDQQSRPYTAWKVVQNDRRLLPLPHRRRVDGILLRQLVVIEPFFGRAADAATRRQPGEARDAPSGMQASGWLRGTAAFRAVRPAV